MFITEFSALSEENIVSKEEEKRTKYQELLEQLRRLWIPALNASVQCGGAHLPPECRKQSSLGPFVYVGHTIRGHSDCSPHGVRSSHWASGATDRSLWLNSNAEGWQAASLSKNLEAITAWGLKDMVEFNASKTRYCTLSNKRCPSEHSVLMNSQALPRSHSFKLARKYFSPTNILTLYKAQIRPSLEYCSHIWEAATPTTLSILDAVQRRAIRLIGDLASTCHLQPLSHRRAVGEDLDRLFFTPDTSSPSLPKGLSQKMAEMS
nr:unnamed protein product [Callosobruchus chinensis]